MAKNHKFVCEGCGTVAVDLVMPDGWFGYGMSAGAPNTTAHWCAECAAKGIMESMSAASYRRAVSVAKSRGLLQQIREATDR